MALELAEDGRDGEARERRLARGIEAVERLQQAERGDLDQVVERLAAALVAPGEVARQREVAPDRWGAVRPSGGGLGRVAKSVEGGFGNDQHDRDYEREKHSDPARQRA